MAGGRGKSGRRHPAKRSRAKPTKRLSRAHRAAIAAGLRRYYRAVKQARAKRRRQAQTRRRLLRIQRQLRAERRERPRTEEWELTLRYSKKGKAVGITMRITAPFGTPRAVVAIVARRAGLPDGSVERGFRVRDIQWQKARKTYDYGEDIETGLQVSGWTGLLASGTIRLERERVQP